MLKNIAVALFLLCLGVRPAAVQFMIEEGKVVLPVAGGERVNKSITIHNTTGADVGVKVYWEDFRYEAPYDGSKAFLPAGTVPGSASAWVSYAPQEFKLPAFSKQKIEYTVSVPADIKGGHYGALFFEKSGEPVRDMRTGVTIVTRTGTLFFIEARDKDKSAALTDFKIEGGKLSGNFVDRGDAVMIPHITFYVMDEAGMAVDRGEVQKLYLPPGASAPFTLNLPKELKDGRYSLVLNADLEEGDVIVKEIEFTNSAAGAVITAVKD